MIFYAYLTFINHYRVATRVLVSSARLYANADGIRNTETFSISIISGEKTVFIRKNQAISSKTNAHVDCLTGLLVECL